MAAFSAASPPEISASVARFMPNSSGINFVGPHRSVASFGDARRAGDSDFIQAIESMHHQRAMQSQHAQRFGQLFDQIERIHSHDLPRSARRIGERAEQIEHGAQAQLAPHGLHLLHRGCRSGAYRKQIPTSRRHCAARSGESWMFTPSASITSAEPHFELMLRLPCLATRTPAPAVTNAVAVEMLKVPLASPPVPLVSTR